MSVVKRGGSESLAVDVRDQLRADIFNRRLAPGERLRPTELGKRFGVSLSVTREALTMLAAQHLVRIERNRGFHVTTLSTDGYADLTFARQVNEGAAMRLAVERGGVEWESEVLAAHHRMASLPMYLPDDPDTRNDEWTSAHFGFHYKLIQPCGNAVLLDICCRIYDEAALYRAWSGKNSEVKRDVAAEHRALLDAAIEHAANLAVALIEAHIEPTAAIVLDLERNRPRAGASGLGATANGGFEGRADENRSIARSP